MKVLVTGAAGFVGSHVCRKLAAESQQVLAIDRVVEPWRLTALLETELVTYVRSEVAALNERLWRDVDEVWHLAANADIPLGARDRRIDVADSAALTVAVLDDCARHGVKRFVFASSASIYGVNDGRLLTEDAVTLRPESMYAAGKLSAEAFIQAFVASLELQATILRFGNLVGPSMQRGIVLDFIRKLRAEPERLRVLGDGKQAKSYVHVADAADAAWWLSRPRAHLSGNVFNVATGDAVSTTEVAALVSSAMGIPTPAIEISTQARSWAGDQPVVRLDVSRAMAAGWSARLSAADAVRQAASELLKQIEHGSLPDV